MKIDLKALLDKKYEELLIDEAVALDNIQRGGDTFFFSKPIFVNGRLYRLEDDVVFFSGSVNTTIVTACSRCLEPVTEAVDYVFDEVVYALGKEEEYDLINEPEGEVLDLDKFIIDLMILKLPLKFLCDEDCKGLCPVCGTNLNTSECNCNKDKIDERFAKLKNLFPDR